uniref:ankyrin repeat domain-containing protein 12-like n=1 Tax=Styela clava TaxID=7725 RepID=UPI00193A2239|nr:ankyrin repeat domain-containing protein 12-like [Styela clava]
MSSMKEKPMKRKLFGSSEHDDKNDSHTVSADKKRRRKNTVEAPKHYPLSERQQLALLMQMTSAENSPEPASPPLTSIRKTPGSTGRKDRVHRRNERGETLLHLSTIKGDLDAMKELIRQGADVNVQDFAGWTPLHEACNHGHQEITRYLLEVGANVNSRGLDNDTPLHDAVTNAHKDLVELLLRHGANPLLKNRKGERPLDIAEDQIIRELMQKEVILSDESDSDAECPSPVRSEDSMEARKNATNMRKTSTSSSSRELFKNDSGKKKSPVLKNDSARSKSSFSSLTSDSSSDSSDSSDDNMPLVYKKLNHHTGNQQRPNGQNLGKTPTLTATPQKSKKLKLMHKHKEGNRKHTKTKVETLKMPLSDLVSSSEGASSDSDYKSQRRESKLITSSKQNDFKTNSLIKSAKKDHAKTNSLYSNEKAHFSERKNSDPSQQVHKKKSTQLDQSKRVRSYSSEQTTTVHTSDMKQKPRKLSDDRQKITSANLTPKVNGFPGPDVKSASSQNHKKEADGSVYDFSLSTEDFTDIGAISLKQKQVDSDELFDILCLGKPSKKIDVDSVSEIDVPNDRRVTSDKAPVVKSQEKQKSLIQCSTASNISHDEEKSLVDKNHNLIVSTDLEKQSKNTNSVLPSHSSQLSQPNQDYLLSKSLNKDKYDKPNVETKTAVGPGIISDGTKTSKSHIKSEMKSEKKNKKHHNTVLDSPRKLSQTGVSGNPVKIEGATYTKKEIKSEHSSDNKLYKVKEQDSTSQVKLSSDKVNSFSSIKKKKKHKHSKHSHESSSSADSKHRSRMASSEHSTSEKTTTAEKDKLSNTPTTKASLKKVDSAKSLLGGSLSRKNSQEGKTEGGTTMRKKNRSTDSTSSETSVKSMKHSNSVTKSVKHSANTPQEKQTTPSSVKRDKPDAKKLALLSDANSFFLSELEKSSRQREMEKKLKLKRKKKLLQQQKLKLQTSSELAAARDSKSNTPNTAGEKTVPFFDKAVLNRPEYPASDQTKLQSTSFPNNVGGVHPLPSSGFTFGAHREHSSSLDESHSIFKSPPSTGRSYSQLDTRSPYIPPLENWRQGERPVQNFMEKRNMPVQRSLSFSSSVPDGDLPNKSHQMLSSELPGLRPDLHHEHLQKRHSIAEDFHHRPLVAGALLNAPQPCSDVATSLPVTNFVTTMPSSTIPQNLPSTPVHGHQNVPSCSKQDFSTSSRSTIESAHNDGTNTSAVAPKPSIPAVTAESSSTAQSVTNTNSNQNESQCASTAISGNVPPETTKRGKDSEQSGNASEGKSDQENKEQEPSEIPLEKKLSPEEEAIIKEEMERKIALEKYVKERLSKLDAVIEEPKPKKLPVFIPMSKLKDAVKKDPVQDRLNVYEEWAVIQKQINDRRKKYATVITPQAPQSYWEYMTYTGGYLLSDSRESWLSVPVLAPPPSLGEEMRALFVEHEKERVKLRLQHASQREKLIVACEQEIIRVHGRAARMIQNQTFTVSACSVLLDREVYNVERRNKKSLEESGTNKSASVRDRFNTRMFISWQQDVGDKYMKMKNILLARQRHESQALHAVQRTEWLLKLQETEQGQQKRLSNMKPEEVNELHVPLVNISDDFALLPAG